MAVRFELCLSDKDFEKIRLLKKADCEDDTTYNDYAEKILSRVISTMYLEYEKKGYIKEEDDK